MAKDDAVHLAFMASPTGMMVCSQNGKVSVMNRAAAELFGHAAAEMVQQHIESVLPGMAALLALPSGYHGADHFQVLHRPNGTKESLVLRITPLSEPEGDGAVLVTIREVGETMAKESLWRHASEELMIGAWESLGDLEQMVWTDTVFGLLDIPPSTPPSFSSLLAHVDEGHRKALQKAYRSAAEMGEPFMATFPITTRRGGRRWLQMTCRSFHVWGKTSRMSGTLVDVTDQHAKEAALRDNQERFLYVSRATRDAIYDINLATEMVWRNDGYQYLFGDIDGEVTSISWWKDHIHPDDRDRVIESAEEAARGNRVFWTNEYRLRRYDTTYAHVIDRAYFIRDSQGRAVRKIGAISDITDRKKDEIKLAQNESRYRSLFENNPVPMWVYDIDTLDFIDVNEAAVKHYGYSKEEFLAMKITQIRPSAADDRALVDVSKSAGNAGDMREFFWKHQKKDGTLIDVELKSQPISIAEHRRTRLVVVNDITQRKKMEQVLRYNETLLKTVFDESDDALFIIHRDRKHIINCNRRAVVMFEATDDSWLVGRHESDLHEAPPPIDYLNHISGQLDTLGQWSSEQRYRTFKGRTFWGSISVKRFTIDKHVYEMIRIADINLRKQAEQQIKTSLHEKEILLKEVHHRVKNNMAVIYSLLSLQAEQFDDESQQAPFMESMNRIRTMSLIHEKLYQSESLAQIDFGNYIQDLVAGFRHSMSAGKKAVAISIDAGNISMDVNKAVPSGLIVNEIITNAFKHAFDGTTDNKIHIAIARENDEYRFIISDNGVGLPMGYEPETATSLGMTLIFGLASQLNADIRITSDKGTTFTLKFPSL